MRSGGSESISGQGAESLDGAKQWPEWWLELASETAQHLSIKGNEISAQAIMAGTAPQRAVGESELGGPLPLACNQDHALFVVLEAEKRAARAAALPGLPYLFVDSTVKEFLPAWMTQDMIGGRFFFAGEASLANVSAVSSTVSASGQELRAGDCSSAIFPFD